MDVVTLAMDEFVELSHCTYYEFKHNGEQLAVAVDLRLRGVWAIRDGELHELSTEEDPELAALLAQDGIRL
ncbi:hypothetical protein [Streptomyces sp. NPDC048560]|uniref:hypothetical protein n=1 Tax=Streptomyces sp. NPDC048560 TaxID=3155488 RepID=UPI0034353065